MPKVFPCFSIADREPVRELAAFLERGCGVEVLLEEGEMPPGADLIAKVEEGLSADAVLVLLSPDSVPQRWPLERWKPVFLDQAAEMGTALANVLCRDARFPDLLRRQHFFDLRRNRLAAFRGVKRWLMSLSPPPRDAAFSPALQPSFSHRDSELEDLAQRLADTPGTAVICGPERAGKTALSLEFCRRHREEFDAVFWIGCSGRTAAEMAGDLSVQLGVRLDRDLESNLNELRRICAQHRCLLVLDDAAIATAAAFVFRGRTSVLLNTRDAKLAGALATGAVPLTPYAGDSDALAEAMRSLERPAQRLLSAMCACAPSGFLLDMAIRTADAEADEAREVTTLLERRGIVAPLDEIGPRCTMTQMVRERAALRGDSARWARHHALALAGLFGSPTERELAPYWPDLQHAFRRALEPDFVLASKLARCGTAWAKTQDRLAEAFELLQAWSAAAEARGDRRVLEECAWEQAWILDHWGRDREARELDAFRRQSLSDQMAFSFD